MTKKNSTPKNLPAVVESQEKKRELKKAVEAVHVSGNTTLMQKKLFNNLAYYALPELAKEETHHVGLSQLCEDVGFDSNNIAFIKKQLKQLLHIILEWNLLGRDGKDLWRASTTLADVEIGEGRVSYSFPPMIRKMLSDPSIFSVINLQLMKRFGSGYAYALYENTHRFKNVGSTGYWDVDVLKKLLGVDINSGAYLEFKHFNGLILKPSINEVNEVSDIILEPEFRREGKRVVAIKFLVTLKQADVPDNFAQSDDQNKVEALRRMLALGISDKMAHIYINENPIEYIQGNLDVVEERIKTSPPGKIKNYPTYFKKAIEEDWRVVTPKIDEDRKKAQQIKAASEKQAREEEKEMARLSAQRLNDAIQYYESKSEEEKSKIVENFVDYLSKHNSMAFTHYNKHGFGSHMLAGTFNTWLADSLKI